MKSWLPCLPHKYAFLQHRHFFLCRPRVVSRALGSSTRRKPARTQQLKCRPWARSTAGTLAVQKSRITTGGHSEDVEPSRPMQTHVNVKMCPTAYVIPSILNVDNVVRSYLVMEMCFPETNFTRYATTFTTTDTISITSEG